MQIERSTWQFADMEMRSNGDGRTLTGLVVPFDVEANIGGRFVEVFTRGAFAKTIADGNASKVKFLSAHNEKAFPLGVTKALKEDARGLVGEFRFSRTQAADEARNLIEDGALDSFSMGFVPDRDVWTNNRSRVERRSVRLVEVSLVSFPAYEDAKVLALRTEETNTPTRTMTLAQARRLASTL